MITTRSNPLSCTLHAPAKLNLCLELLGKRPDGFHDLRTVMATLSLRDTLRVELDPEIGMTLDPASPAGIGVPVDESNLVLRALRMLRAEARIRQGASVRLHKRIPHGAGLGGGSSDAAAALIAGCRVWSIDWPLERLMELGGRLGSDIPFFVRAISEPGNSLALATGRGERVVPRQLRFQGQPAVVLKPEKSLSTGAVYQACEPGDYVGDEAINRCERLLDALQKGRVPGPSGMLSNGLSLAAFRVAPWLEGVKRAFQRCGCHLHQLSGSGSAYFGWTRTVSEAVRLAARLRALRLGRVYSTTFG